MLQAERLEKIVGAKGAENAERIAYKPLRKVYKKVGFVPRERV